MSKGESGLLTTVFPECEEEGQEYEEHFVNGPFIGTVWGQDEGFNAYTPVMGCSVNGHAPTGCVSLAMAEVMNYYQHPNSITWNPSGSGVTTTNQLIAAIGATLNTSYSCTGSGADMKDVDDTFLLYGYANADYYSNYNATVAENNLWNSKPVIVGAGTKWYAPWKGHAWVIEGVWRWTEYVCHIGNEVWDPNGLNRGLPPDSDHNWFPKRSYLRFYMNWGWYGDANGWYGYAPIGWTPNGSAPHQYWDEMIANITP